MTGRDWLAPAAWAAWVGVLATGMLVWSGDGLTPALLGGAALAALAVAAIRLIFRADVAERVLVDTSAAPPLIAAGVTVALNGVAFGLWLILIGAELAAFGLLLLLRERRAMG